MKKFTEMTFSEKLNMLLIIIVIALLAYNTFFSNVPAVVKQIDYSKDIDNINTQIKSIDSTFLSNVMKLDSIKKMQIINNKQIILTEKRILEDKQYLQNANDEKNIYWFKSYINMYRLDTVTRSRSN